MFHLNMRLNAKKSEELKRAKHERQLEWAKEMEEEETLEDIEKDIQDLEKSMKMDVKRTNVLKDMESRRTFKVKDKKKKSDFGENSEGPALAEMLRKCREDNA